MFNFSTQFYEGRYVPTKVIKLSTCFVVLMGTKNDQPRSLSLHWHRRIRLYGPWPSLHRHRVGLKRSEVGLDGHRTNDLSTSIYLGFRSLGSFSPLPPTLMTWTDFFWGRIWTCNLFHCVALALFSLLMASCQTLQEMSDVYGHVHGYLAGTSVPEFWVRPLQASDGSTVS